MIILFLFFILISDTHLDDLSIIEKILLYITAMLAKSCLSKCGYNSVGSIICVKIQIFRCSFYPRINMRAYPLTQCKKAYTACDLVANPFYLTHFLNALLTIQCNKLIIADLSLADTFYGIIYVRCSKACL